MKRCWFLLCLLLTLGAAAPLEPADRVERFHATLLGNMQQGAALDCKARAARLDPVVSSGFDLPFIARFVLRKRWSGLSEAQQQRFARALQRMVVGSYAANFRSYDGERFTTVDTIEQASGQRVVHSLLERKGGEPVHFDYVLHLDEHGEWRIINVVADGVSDLALRSAQYDKLYAERGFDALVAWIEGQAHNDKDGC